MKIKKMISQHRRDFYADFECEGCGNVEFKKEVMMIDFSMMK